MGCQTLGMSRSCKHVSPIDPKVNPREIVFTSRVLGLDGGAESQPLKIWRLWTSCPLVSKVIVPR